MLKKIILLSCLGIMSLPVLADEILINQTPAKQFSGLTNSAKPQYPALYRSKSVVDMEYEDDMAEMEESNKNDAVTLKKEIKKNPSSSKVVPMNYGNFPQNYDSSNSMMMMPGMMNGIMNQAGY